MLRGKAKLDGIVSEKSLGGDKNDLKTVQCDYMGGKFTFYNVDEVYDQTSVGDQVTIDFDIEADPKAGGNNKLRLKKGSATVKVKSGAS